MIYPKSIATLIEHFQKFPSVGPKSAQRMAFYMLRMPESEVQKFAQAILEAKRNTRTCEVCFNLSSASPCEICTNPKRDRSIICVVAETKDLIAIEKTNEFKGLYHVLQGLISPMDGIGADDIRIKELLTRLASDEVKGSHTCASALCRRRSNKSLSYKINKTFWNYNLKNCIWTSRWC